MQYGFVIDQTTCIGCHACTVACKAENNVPVGDFRTSVKYTELGLFPDVKRLFLVQRCNHCTDAPCVTICPVNALEKRKDGIVDLDREACIGCRACMQACPYDAIYLNEDTGAAEKCHYCAHRTELGLKPACVNVCPTESIIAGDLHDEDSYIARLVDENDTKRRRVEQKTDPNVHYIGAQDVSLKPGNAKRPPMYLWSDRPHDKPEHWPAGVPTTPDATVVFDSGHKIEWGWLVALYLVTKGIAGGVALFAPFVSLFREGFGLTDGIANYAPEVIALLFTVITCGILVEDLARPWKFYRLLTRPNWSSWLVKGGVILSAFMAMTVIAIAARVSNLDWIAEIVRWINVPIGASVAGYTAHLFWQCKGRDLWEDRLLMPHLIAQAVMCGGVAIMALSPMQWLSFFSTKFVLVELVVAAAIVVHLALALHVRYHKHKTDNARQAAGFLDTVKLGPFKAFRDSLLIGVGAGLIVLFIWPGAAFIPVLLGLFLYEHAFVRAGQLPPLS